MSNTVDVLLVDGPCAGRMMNCPRPVATIATSGTVYNPVSYQHPVDSKFYWICVYDLEGSPDIPAAIAAANHQPAWDLNNHV